MHIPNPPPAIDADEWRRAIALIAATTTHAENTTLSPMTRETNVLNSAKKFEAYLRTGR